MNFSEAMFYENYLTSDFHTNTLISRRVCLLVKMASKTVIRPILHAYFSKLKELVMLKVSMPPPPPPPLQIRILINSMRLYDKKKVRYQKFLTLFYRSGEEEADSASGNFEPE